MSLKLPSILPVGNSSGLNHPQSLPKPKAKISISDSESKKAVSSISNLKGSTNSSVFSRPNNVRTSINGPTEDQNQSKADDLRYNYVRRLIIERKNKENKGNMNNKKNSH